MLIIISRQNSESNPGVITNKSLLSISLNNNDTNISNSQIKGKFTINSSLQEGVDFVVLSESVAYMLYNTYGVDFILKSKKRHVFTHCLELEKCGLCLDIFSSKDKFSVFSLYKNFFDSMAAIEEDRFNNLNINSGVAESFAWGYSLELSNVSKQRKRGGCLSILGC